MEVTVPPDDNRHSNYRLLGLVGQGQFGQVYGALHRKTGQLVALKNLNRNRLPTRRFLRELRFLLSLEHPHIANCCALEQTDTGRQLVLDYCEAGTLRSLIEQEAQLTLAEILTLTIEVLTALEHAHSAGIVHCDIKPENILLSLTPDGWMAKVSDFGIARLSQELKGGAYSGATGSPAYMAPERFYHQYAEASDLYAVGVVLYELLVGDRPFSGNHSQLMVAHLNHPVTLPSTLPQAVQSLLHKALEKLMARRFTSALEMRTAIAALHQTLTMDELQRCFPQPMFKIPPSAFRSQEVIALAEVCSTLHVLPTWGETAPMLLTANGREVFGWTLSETGELASSPLSQKWSLDAIVDQVISSVGEAIAAVGTCLYQLPPGQTPQRLVNLEESFRVVLGYQRWILLQSTLVPARFWLVDTRSHVPQNPRSFTLKTPQGTLQSLFLDDRHLLVADVVGGTTDLQMLTRWGNPLAELKLNTPLHQLAPSQTPYQFLAQGGTHRQDLLVIHLKPLRVMRCRLDITATWLGELVIGYVGISAAGQLRIANFQGQMIGQVDGLPPPTAIAFSPPYHIWLTTNQDRAPRLHCIDIRKLDLDIVF